MSGTPTTPLKVIGMSSSSDSSDDPPIKAPPLRQLQKMIESELPVEQLAEELGVSPATFYKWVDGLLPQRRQARDAKVIKDYQKTTIPVYKVLQINEISQGTLYTILRRHDIPLRRSKDQTATTKQIAELYRDGEVVSSIVAKTGRSINYIYQALRKHNVPLRRPSTNDRQPLTVQDIEPA